MAAATAMDLTPDGHAADSRRPRLTVLIPFFNREEFIDEAIDSVLAQDFTDFELLLVDDASTDGTAEILREWAKKDPRIVLVTAPRHLGIARAPNLGLERARGDYVARLDSDDVMTPGRLSAQLRVLEQHPDVVLVSTAYELIDRDGHHLGTWREQHPHEVVKYFLNFYNIVGGGGHVMFRRKVALEEGGYDASVPTSDDFALWVRLLRRGRIVILPMIGMQQRDHGGRATFEFKSLKRANWTAIMKMSLAPYLDRQLRDEEIAALLTLWRDDGALGMAPTADATTREAFARFCREHRDAQLRRAVRRRTARQWIDAARLFIRAGHRAEAMQYVLRAARWSPAAVLEFLARRAGRRATRRTARAQG